MTPLRILNTVVWGVMAIYMLQGAWSAMFGPDTRRGDPMRLGCLLTAIVMVGFNIRWLFWPDAMVTWQALYVLSAGTGLYIIWLAHAYGRGPRV